MSNITHIGGEKPNLDGISMTSTGSITCDRELLSKGVAIVQRAVSPRSTLPILQGIFIETSDKGLHLIGTDLELSMETYVPTTSSGNFQMVLPAKYLSDIVRRLPERELVIHYDTQKRVATISSGKAKYEINSMEPEEYPLFPEIPETSWWKVCGKDFANFVKKTAFCVAVEESRPFLTGVFVEFLENEIRLVATDSFRLALVKVTTDDIFSKKNNKGLLIPARTLNEVGRIVQGTDTEINVYASENQVAFKWENTTVVSRLIEGQFPTYDRVIPERHSTLITVEKEKFQESVDRVSIMGQDEFGTIRLNTKEEILTISANTPQIGKAVDKIATLKVKGENGDIALKSRYLTDALKAIDDEQISLKLTGSTSPVVITHVEDGSENPGGFLYLIMPVTLDI